MSPFGRKFQEILNYKEANQSEVARAAGVSIQMINRYLKSSGYAYPAFDTVQKIAKYFKIHEQYFYSNIPPETYYAIVKLYPVIIHIADFTSEQQKALEEIFASHAGAIAAAKTKSYRASVEVEN